MIENDSQLKNASGDGHDPFQKWEYKVERHDSFYGPDIEKLLKELGQEGWEMTGITSTMATHATSLVVYFFKRPIKV